MIKIYEEDKMKNFINFVTGTLATALVYFLGGWDIALQTLLIVIVLDYITGICKAIYNKKINSSVGLKGIMKKVGYLIIVAVAVILDRIAGNTGAIRTLVIYFFVANEGISILENWGGMSLPLPKKLTDTLEQLKYDNNPKNNSSSSASLSVISANTSSSINISLTEYTVASFPSGPKYISSSLSYIAPLPSSIYSYAFSKHEHIYSPNVLGDISDKLCEPQYSHSPTILLFS